MGLSYSIHPYVNGRQARLLTLHFLPHCSLQVSLTSLSVLSLFSQTIAEILACLAEFPPITAMTPTADTTLLPYFNPEDFTEASRTVFQWASDALALVRDLCLAPSPCTLNRHINHLRTDLG